MITPRMASSARDPTSLDHWTTDKKAAIAAPANAAGQGSS